MCVFFYCYALSYEMDIFFWLKTNSENSISCSARKHLLWDCARHLVKNVSVQIDFNVDCWFWWAILSFLIHTHSFSVCISIIYIPVCVSLIFVFVIGLRTICKYCEQKSKFFSQLFNVKSEQHILRIILVHHKNTNIGLFPCLRERINLC